MLNNQLRILSLAIAAAAGFGIMACAKDGNGPSSSSSSSSSNNSGTSSPCSVNGMGFLRIENRSSSARKLWIDGGPEKTMNGKTTYTMNLSAGTHKLAISETAATSLSSQTEGCASTSFTIVKCEETGLYCDK